MRTAGTEGTSKLREPENMKDHLGNCAGEESKTNKCLKVMETLAYQRPGRRKASLPTPFLLQMGLGWKVGRARLLCLLARSPYLS